MYGGRSPPYDIGKTMKIEDEELRVLFQAESEEHLQRMDEGLLRLEQEPQNQSVLEEVYREAHSLKGAARMIGVRDVETVAHRFEDLLGPAKRGQATLTADLVDRLSKVLEGMRQLVDQAITGNPSGVDIISLLDSLTEPSSDLTSEKSKPSPPPQSEIPSTSSTTTLSKGPEQEENIVGWAPPTIPLEEETKPASRTTASPETPEKATGKVSLATSETIRVDSKRLDSLMMHAGELTVTKSRLNHRVHEIDQLRMLRDRWRRDLPQHRVMITKAGASLHKELGGQLQRFYQEQQSRLEEFGELLEHFANAAHEDQQRLESLAYQIDEGVRNVRLLPFSILFERYRRTVRDISRELGKSVDLVIEGGDTKADKQVLDELKAPLMHVVRNAIDHGIETQEERIKTGKPRSGTVRLSASQRGNTIVVTVTDDGRGLDVEAIKQTALRHNMRRKEELDSLTSADLYALVMASGFSTSKAISDISGRGIGMDVVRTTVERLKGTISLDSVPGKGCQIHIELPVTLSTMRVLTIFVDQNSYAVPIEFVEGVRLVQLNALFSLEGHKAMSVDGETVSVIPFSDLLQIKKGSEPDPKDGEWALKGERGVENHGSVPCVLLKGGTFRMGFLVDTLGDEQEVVLKPYSTLLKRVRNVSGCTILGTGEICTILNPADLLRSAQKRFSEMGKAPVSSSTNKQTILLVEDSLTIRAHIKGKLQQAGYEVVTAVDGIDGFNRLQSQPFEAVISDVQMPRMDGFALTTTIRNDPAYTNLPVILFTSLSDEESQLRGQDAGATAYVVKTEFADVFLIETLGRLLKS